MKSAPMKSMTGFGRAQLETSGVRVVCEIKALNGRYFEADVRLPKYLYEIDPAVRKILNEKLERGTVNCSYSISFTAADAVEYDINVNVPLAKAYVDQWKLLSDSLSMEFKDPFREVLKIPEVVFAGERTISEAMKSVILSATEMAAEKLNAFRVEEGAATAKKLSELAELIHEDLQVVIVNEEPRKEQLREKIYNNLAQHIKEGITDPGRFEQEVLIYLDKWDIGEEKQRLAQHLQYFKDCLHKEPLGRKLNFIAQEMGREMNTMGVKSNYFPMQQAVVQMKEKLEQIKEQVLNIV